MCVAYCEYSQEAKQECWSHFTYTVSYIFSHFWPSHLGKPLIRYGRSTLESQVDIYIRTLFWEQVKVSTHLLRNILNLVQLHIFLVQITAHFFAHVPCSKLSSTITLLILFISTCFITNYFICVHIHSMLKIQLNPLFPVPFLKEKFISIRL